MSYKHRFLDGAIYEQVLGKIVCVGRNYAEHARELNNPVPTEPILFIKPATAAVPMSEPLQIVSSRGEHHFETEIAVLIGRQLTRADRRTCERAIAGVGAAFDLTLRGIQNELKDKGHPWEKAKAFDGSCPLSVFVRPGLIESWDNIRISLLKNDVLCQDDSSASMITPILDLLSYISEYFSLMPGDVVLTGTPKGVGALSDGDALKVDLNGLLSVSTRVEAI